MATDDYLASDKANEFEATAPLHAVRALTELHAEAATDPLLTYSVKASWNDDEWMLETLVDFHLTIGPAALPSLEQFLAAPSHDDSAQNYAAEILGKMPQKHPEARTECIAVATRRLADFEVNHPELNEALVRALLRMKAVKSASIIQEVYASGRVDDFWGIDWDEAQYELGLKERPATSETFSPPSPTHKSTKNPPASKKAQVKMPKPRKRQTARRNKEEAWQGEKANDPSTQRQRT